MNNESPVGLATYLGLIPAALGVIIFAVAYFVNDGDVEQAQGITLAIITAVSLIGTSALRQWRAVSGGIDPNVIPGGRPLPSGADEEPPAL